MPSNGFLISSVHLSVSVAVCLLCLLNVSKIEKMPGVPVVCSLVIIKDLTTHNNNSPLAVFVRSYYFNECLRAPI
jgi:hypothetical protein